MRRAIQLAEVVIGVAMLDIGLILCPHQWLHAVVGRVVLIAGIASFLNAPSLAPCQWQGCSMRPRSGIYRLSNLEKPRLYLCSGRERIVAGENAKIRKEGQK